MGRPVERSARLADPDTRRKLVRYAVTSGVNVVIGQVALALLFGLLHWSARSAAVVAATVAAFPAYWMARRWVWGRSGRSDLMKEVVPFWTLALLGLVFATVAADLGERVGTGITASRFGQTLVVMTAVLGASAVFWVFRFVVLNRLLFADRDPASD